MNAPLSSTTTISKENVDRLDFFVALLDHYLMQGKSPKKALVLATDDYAYEFHHDACFG